VTQAKIPLKSIIIQPLWSPMLWTIVEPWPAPLVIQLENYGENSVANLVRDADTLISKINPDHPPLISQIQSSRRSCRSSLPH